MDFFNSAVDVLQTLVIALGAGLGVWGVTIFWKATATTTPAQMLMCGKVSQRNFVELTATPLFRKHSKTHRTAIGPCGAFYRAVSRVAHSSGRASCHCSL